MTEYKIIRQRDGSFIIKLKTGWFWETHGYETCMLDDISWSPHYYSTLENAEAEVRELAAKEVPPHRFKKEVVRAGFFKDGKLFENSVY